ncbi:MAG: flagellar FliJ family protein [Opitutaceae bacterium]
MKRFRFPLRPVMVLRAHQELRAREAFGASVSELARAEDARATTRSRVARFAATLSAGRQERFSAAAEAHSLAGYRRECAVEAGTERAMVVARSTMQQRRAEYLEAHRRLEAVHRLEAKARTAHRLEANRTEQAEFDDRAGRQSGFRTRFSL